MARGTTLWGKVPHRRLLQFLTIFVALSAVVLTIVFTRDIDNNDAAPKPEQVEETWKVLAPQDGELLVATTSIDQLRGYCAEAASCNYATSTTGPVEVVISDAVKSVPLKSATSTVHTVSAFSLTGVKKFNFTASGGRLSVQDAPVGGYRLAVQGDDGGVWQFDLIIEDEKKKQNKKK